MNGISKTLERINEIIDRKCKAQCGKVMTADCKEKHCRNYIILDNAMFHKEMGWINLIYKKLKMLEEE